MSKGKLKRVILTAAIGVMAVFASGCSNAKLEHTMTVSSFNGEVSVDRIRKLDVSDGMELASGDGVEIGAASSVELLADSDKHITAEENTSFRISSLGNDEEGNVRIFLQNGKALFSIDNYDGSSCIDVKTPNSDLSLRGSSFSATYISEENATSVEVHSGKVRVSADGNIMFLEEGESAVIKTTDGKIEILKNEKLDRENEGNNKPIVTTANEVSENTDKGNNSGNPATTASSSSAASETPVVTTVPNNGNAVVTTKKTTTSSKTEKPKEESETSKSNAIKMQEVGSGRYVYVDIPSGYKLWEYDASDYKKEGKLYGALFVPKKSGKYNISISFESGDPMKTLIKKGTADYGGLSYKVTDEYKCSINKTKKGTVYIAEVKESGKSQGYTIIVEGVSSEDTYLIIQHEDQDGNTLPILTSRLYGSTKDIKKFAKQMFPKS